ncbi:MAG TPA: matrixin family metalloprotease [Actinomycetota bacterium]|nr:matrixin family metalloprotease [Actinomycetota bacterium]
MKTALLSVGLLLITATLVPHPPVSAQPATLLQQPADHSVQNLPPSRYPDPPRGPIIDIAAAPFVVTGVAGSTSSEWSGQEGKVTSVTRFVVEESIRGGISGTINIHTDQGTAPDENGEVRMTHTEHSPIFRSGQRSRLFLERIGREDFYVRGLDEGKQDDPSSVSGEGTGGSGDGVELAESYDTVSPGCPSTDYCFTGLKWQVTSLPATYYIDHGNNDGLSGDSVRSAIQAAFQTWENDPASYMDFDYRGTAAGQTSFNDGLNTVWFAASSTCGVSTNYYACAQSHGSGGHFSGFDIWINDGYSWSTTGQQGRIDLESVMLHEAGHALGLHHPPTSCSASVMTQGCLSAGQLRRSLLNGDVAGVRALYTNHSPRGSVDSMNCNTIAGWTYDPDQPIHSISVHIYVDGVGYDIGPARIARPDINDVNGPEGVPGDHGYVWQVPILWSDYRPHTVTVYAINIPDGPHPVIGSGTLGPCAKQSTNGQLLVADPAGAAFAVHGGTKNAIASPQVLDSYSSRWIDGTNTGMRWDRIKRVHNSGYDALPAGQVIHYREGSLISSPSTGKIYVVDQVGEWPTASWVRRYIPGPADYSSCGFKDAWVRSDPHIESAAYVEGLQVTAALCSSRQRPDGQLIKTSDDSMVYLISGGVARPIMSGQAYESWGFNWNNIVEVTAAELSLYPRGPGVFRAEGSLVVSGTQKYVIQQTGDTFSKRPIADECTFQAHGFDSADVLPFLAGESVNYSVGAELRSCGFPEVSTSRNSGS